MWRRTGLTAMAAVAIALPASAPGQIWETLEGEDLHAAFEAQVLDYGNGAVQSFEPGGLTKYHKPNAIDLQGLWWVDSDLLCFFLKPGSPDCYKVERHENGVQLKLEGENGGTVKLRYRNEQ
jgi:hypothetical protein